LIVDIRFLILKNNWNETSLNFLLLCIGNCVLNLKETAFSAGKERREEGVSDHP
jgi:hypothetical protein